MSDNKSEYEDVLKSHSYDGIQEYDNPMPYWWKAVFVVTIIWSVYYVVAMEMNWINTYEANLSEDTRALNSVRALQKKARPEVTPELLLAATTDATALVNGEKVYTSLCAACHGPQGQGLIGPNLADAHWIHGGAPLDIYQMVVVGVPAKGMPAWENIISFDDAIHVSAYIINMEGANPPNPKAPEGEEYLPN